jgi:hypothetical protein
MVGTVGAVMALLLSVLYLQVVMLQRQRSWTTWPTKAPK